MGVESLIGCLRGYYSGDGAGRKENLTPGPTPLAVHTPILLSQTQEQAKTGRVCDSADEYVGRRLDPPLPDRFVVGAGLRPALSAKESKVSDCETEAE